MAGVLLLVLLLLLCGYCCWRRGQREDVTALAGVTAGDTLGLDPIGPAAARFETPVKPPGAEEEALPAALLDPSQAHPFSPAEGLVLSAEPLEPGDAVVQARVGAPSVLKEPRKLHGGVTPGPAPGLARCGWGVSVGAMCDGAARVVWQSSAIGGPVSSGLVPHGVARFGGRQSRVWERAARDWGTSRVRRQRKKGV